MDIFMRIGYALAVYFDMILVIIGSYSICTYLIGPAPKNKKNKEDDSRTLT